MTRQPWDRSSSRSSSPIAPSASSRGSDEMAGRSIIARNATSFRHWYVQPFHSMSAPEWRQFAIVVVPSASAPVAAAGVAIDPPITKPDGVHRGSQVLDVGVCLSGLQPGRRIEDRLVQVLDVPDVVAETSEPNDVVQRLPRHAAE